MSIMFKHARMTTLCKGVLKIEFCIDTLNSITKLYKRCAVLLFYSWYN